MDRRTFLNTLSASAAASITAAPTLSAKADALEDAMEAGMEKRRIKPGHCYIGEERDFDPNDNTTCSDVDEDGCDDCNNALNRFNTADDGLTLLAGHIGSTVGTLTGEDNRRALRA